ncbi:hypothetical protein [Bacillus sp. JJ783]|uniref:hypothetical protein n=1 Tax=Bacillus sp. JJ783 TaxID=3122974 RepID=UPI003001B811
MEPERNIILEITSELKPIGATSALSYTPLTSIVLGALNVQALIKKINILNNDIKAQPTLIGYYIEKICEKLDVKNTDIFNAANLSKSYFYQIKKGQKHPSRNTLISLCFAFPLNVSETNLFFKKGGYNELYFRDTRDAIIAHCLEKKHNLIATNIELDVLKLEIIE